MTNITPTTTYEAEFDQLCLKGSAWIEGTRLQSDNELYLLLGDCNDLLAKLRKGTSEERSAFTEMLKEKGHSFNASASLERKVLTAVLGKIDQLDTYVAVLTYAKKAFNGDTSFAEFVRKEGGVDEIRRNAKNGKSRKQEIEENKAIAKQALSTATAIGASFAATGDLQPSTDGDHNYTLAVVRVDAGNQASIVAGLKDETLISAALAKVGKRIVDQNEQEALEALKAMSKEDRLKLVQATQSVPSPDSSNDTESDPETQAA